MFDSVLITWSKLEHVSIGISAGKSVYLLTYSKMFVELFNTMSAFIAAS